MKKLIVLVLVLLTLFAGYWFYRFGTQQELRFTRLSPESDAGPLPALAARPSQLRLVARLPYGEIRREAEKLVPRTLQGEIGDVTRYLKKDRLSWRLEREAIRIGGGDGQLLASTLLHGQATLKGRLELFGKGIEQQARGRFSAVVDTALSPRVLPDWHIEPNLVMKARLLQAEVPIARFRISIRKYVQPHLDREVRKVQQQLNERIRRDGTLRHAVGLAWKRMCRAEPLSFRLRGQSLDLTLVSQPRGLSVSQPGYDGNGVTEAGGAEVLLQLVEGAASQPKCGPLPEAKYIPLEEDPGRIRLELRLGVGWESLQTLLERNAGLSGFEILSLTGSPGGRAVVELRSTWQDARPSLHARIASRPTIEGSRLVFRNIEIGRDPAGSGMEELGRWIMSDQLESLQRGRELDLSPWLAEIRDGLNRVLRRAGLPVELEVEKVSLDAVHPRPGKLWIDVAVQGRAGEYRVDL